MKILHVTAVDFTLKNFLLPLVDALQNEGHDVEVACHIGETGTELKNNGYKIHHIPFARNLNIFSHLSNVFRLVKLIRTENYQCIHAHTPIASLISRLASKIARVPAIIYTAHGFYFHENMHPIVYKITFFIEKFWGKYFTDYVFFQSIEDYRLALEKGFKIPERLLHIGNGVSDELFNPAIYDRVKLRNENGFKETDIILIFVGRPVREKGVFELIGAFQNLKRQHSEIKLMIIGDNAEGDRNGINIPELISNLPELIRKDIYFLGMRFDVPQLLYIADIFILPSYREGLPRSIIEAMAMEKPIIATDIRGCREEVIPAYNGYLCQVKNSRDLANKIDLLLSAPEIIQQFGKNSRLLYLSKFTEQTVLDKQINIYRQIQLEVKDV